MNIQKHRLLIDQIDKKLSDFKPIQNITSPHKGWINSIRVAMKMTLRQLGNRLGISAQSVKEIEEREISGSITLNSLRETANALDMQFVYGFVPKNESIEKMIERKAHEKAIEIVMRTSQNMKLEDQENSNERINKAIKNKTEEIKNKLPKYLWD
ncbi:MAG TPA: mobile mystery protein A [Bacteroidia bacterium]